MSRAVMQQALEALEWEFGLNPVSNRTHETITALRAALAEPEQEPVAVKHMMQWVERLKRLSDDGQHMNIPGLSSGACWELAAELEQFIKSTAPTPRRPLTDEEIHAIYDEVARREPDSITVARRNIARAIEAKLKEKNT